jgi:hypothetical protein
LSILVFISESLAREGLNLTIKIIGHLLS